MDLSDYASARLKHADLLVGPASMKLLPTSFSLYQPHIYNYLQPLYSCAQVSVSKRLQASAVIHESRFLVFIVLCTFRKQVSLCNEIRIFPGMSPVSEVVWGLWVTIICVFKFPVYFHHTLSTLQMGNGALWRTNTQVQQYQEVSMKNATFVNIFIICFELKIAKNLSL